MPFQTALPLADLPAGTKKSVKLADTEILLIHTAEGTLHAVEAKCPHAGAPLEQGAVCHGRLICPWHTGSFALFGDGLPEGTLLEPPPLRSLHHYACKIEGDSILVNPHPLNSPSLANYNDTAPSAAVGADLHIATIGGGAAATAAVVTLRQAGFAGRLTVIDPVASEPVDRTNLSKMALAGKKPLNTLPLWSPDAQTKLQVERIASRVDRLDPDRGTLLTADGQQLSFDAALLAPGGEPKRLGLPGETLPHVFVIRHLSDLEGINALLGEDAKGRQAVLIGDSFIAFEAASALTGRGLHATVVCRSPQPFSKKFGETPAQAILGLHQANGVTLKLGAETASITEQAVTLKSGETLPADVVIVAIGVQVATAFAHGLTLEEDGGVPVDTTLQAGARLWVAGDAASVDGTRIEHWRLAQQHGRLAAAAMLHQLTGTGSTTPIVEGADPGANGAETEPTAPPELTPARFTGVPFFWTAHFGKRFGYAGHADAWDDLQVDGSPGDAKFLAYYVQGDQVKAVLGCGKDTALAMLTESLRAPLTLEQARQAAASV